MSFWNDANEAAGDYVAPVKRTLDPNSLEGKAAAYKGGFDLTGGWGMERGQIGDIYNPNNTMGTNYLNDGRMYSGPEGAPTFVEQSVITEGGYRVPLGFAQQNGLKILGAAPPDVEHAGSGFDRLMENVVGPAMQVGIPLAVAAGAGGMFGSGTGIPGYLNGASASTAAGAGGSTTGGVNSMANLFGSGTSTTGTGLGFNPSLSSELGFKLGSGAATTGAASGASPGIIQQLANFTGLSASAIQSLGGAAISSIASLVGAGMTADAAKKAAQGIADSNASSNQLMAQINAQNQARQEPFYQAGLKALPAYSQGVMPGGNLVRPFSNADFQADPGYGFRLSEGMKTLENSAASRGNLLSGATLKGIQKYGQGLASQEYQNAYNRYTGDQATQRNALASLTGFAPTASAVMQSGDVAYGTNAANLASNTANAMAGAGATRSSSYGNALAGIGQNVYNAMNPNPMNSIMAAYMQNQMTPRTGVA
ncbi:hypothetical protein UFOVP773_41 [uncultured Caudovirales phage]|uniref:DNA transfer protein n=1 Tax=uncultured Caudovirales phage TaxID=2100421 RepID=A0A6J5NR81_9CAUD|nr:hypothetical protein UFOVP773_41 [uncultured Caudovirales phage]